jgi:hypothetical protein
VKLSLSGSGGDTAGSREEPGRNSVKSDNDDDDDDDMMMIIIIIIIASEEADQYSRRDTHFYPKILF